MMGINYELLWFKFLFTSMTWVPLFTPWIWNLAMHPSFMFVEFNFPLRKSCFLTVQSAVMTWHSQWPHYCYIPQSMEVPTWEDGLGSNVWKLESWRIKNKGLRLRAHIPAKRTHDAPSSSQPLTPVVPSPWQFSLFLGRIPSLMPFAWHSCHGLSISDPWDMPLWPDIGEKYICDPAETHLCHHGLLEVQVSLIPVYQAFEIQGIYASERSCWSPSF